MKKILMCLIFLFFCFILMNCNTPTMSTMEPNSKVSHMPSFMLTVTGSNFDSNSLIVFNDVEKATTFVSSSELTCQIDPDDIAVGPATIQVLVRNSGTFGGDSDPMDFTVRGEHTFTSPVLIATHVIEYLPAHYPTIELNNEQVIHIGWNETGGWSSIEGDCYFIRSEDLGSTWNSKIMVAPYYYCGNFYPLLCLDGTGAINYIYTKQLNSAGPADVFFRRSTNGGVTWSGPVEVTDTWFSTGEDIAMLPSGRILIVLRDWNYPAESETDIKLKGSTTNGSSWYGPVNISKTIKYSQYSKMAIDDSGNIDVVWVESTNPPKTEIGFSRSTDGGSTWSPSNYISDLTNYVSNPEICVDEIGNIYVIWGRYYNDTNKIVQFTKSTDGGVSWITPLDIINTTNSNFNIEADQAGNINLIYRDSNLRFMRSIDRGMTWNPAVDIPISTPLQAEMALDQYGNIYIAITHTDLYFCRSDH
jgi:hypothetical protein